MGGAAGSTSAWDCCGRSGGNNGISLKSRETPRGASLGCHVLGNRSGGDRCIRDALQAMTRRAAFTFLAGLFGTRICAAGSPG